MDGSNSRIPRVSISSVNEPAEIATDSPWSVRVESFHNASGLLTSFTVYRVVWTGPGSITGVVEHRYSDFLSLHAHLVKVAALLPWVRVCDGGAGRLGLEP